MLKCDLINCFIVVSETFCCERVTVDIIQAIKSRESVRSFSDKKVESEKLTSILEMARLAPSFFSRHEWRLVIVQDEENKKKLVDYANCPAFVAEAPIVIVGCGKPIVPISSSDQSSYVIDAAIAMNHITLAAVEYGLGSCWVSIFDEKKVKEILQIPQKVRVIALLALGYPKEIPTTQKKRLPLAQLIKFEKY